MKKLLITGFEPFGGESINPSWEAVKRLPDKIGGYSIHKMLVPVVFGEAAKSVIEASQNFRPDVIISIGQAGGRDAITPELVGINLRHAAVADNAGYTPIDEAIINGGDAAYFSTLPVRKMTSAINDSGIPAKVSYSAGTYVCNELLYTLLSHFDKTKTKVGFIHIPYCKEQSKEPNMSLDDIIKAITEAISQI